MKKRKVYEWSFIGMVINRIGDDVWFGVKDVSDIMEDMKGKSIYNSMDCSERLIRMVKKGIGVSKKVKNKRLYSIVKDSYYIIDIDVMNYNKLRRKYIKCKGLLVWRDMSIERLNNRLDEYIEEIKKLKGVNEK